VQMRICSSQINNVLAPVVKNICLILTLFLAVVFFVYTKHAIVCSILHLGLC